MTSSYNDSVMSFDLAYLQQPSSNIDFSKVLKCRKNIAKIKSKILTVNAVLTRCAEQNEIIESTSKSLFTSKEECKQLCIDYKNVLEKCENLENDIKTLQLHNQQLHNKLTDAQNQYCGMQSLAKQLEVLAKEREIQIESLTVENNLEKANSKKIASRSSSLQKRNERLFRDLCTLGKFLVGNKNLPAPIRETLRRYSEHIKEDDQDSCQDSNGDQSDNDIDVFDSNLKTSEHYINKREDQKSSIEIQEMIVVNLSTTEKENTSNHKLDEMDRYSDCSNEIASADTGRGSSLAFSDSEKCFLSPDTFVTDNHDSSETISKATKGTSPKHVVETADIATSPLRIETPIIIPIITIDKAVGPDESIINEKEPCPQNCDASETMLPTMIDASIQDDTNAEEVHITDIQEKECLQVNSSENHIDEDSGNDEVEMILKKMKFNRKLITPIPSSPSNSRNSVISEVSRSQTDQSVIATMTKQIQFLLTNQPKIIKAIVDIQKQTQSDTNLNEDIDISELTELIALNSDIEETVTCLNESNHIEELRKEDNNNDSEKRHHDHDCAQSVQSRNENNPDPDDLIEMEDLIQISHHEHMPSNDISITNGQQVMDDEEITDSLTFKTHKQPISNNEEQENSSDRMIGRLEFEEDAICASLSQPSDLNNETSVILENVTVDNNPSAIKPLHCNDRIRRKISKLNKLEKLRRKMVPKCKIQREMALTKKPRVQKQINKCFRRLNVKIPKKKITTADSSASLNDKTVYDNAVRIMTEFKSKRTKEPIHKNVLKLDRLKKAKNVHFIKPRHAEKYHKSSKKQSDNTDLSLEQLTTVSTEKPFDVSDLMSKLTKKPIKSLIMTNSQIKSNENNNCIDLTKPENNQSIKLMQPVILVDKIQEIKDLRQEIQYDKTSQRNNINTSKPSSPSINTRSRGKCVEKPQLVSNDPSTAEDISIKDSRKRLKRILSDDNPDIEHKRILRSSTRQSNIDENLKDLIISDNLVELFEKDSADSKSPTAKKCSDETKNSSLNNKVVTAPKTIEHNKSISYDDLDIFDETGTKRPGSETIDDTMHVDPKDSILCSMLEKYSLNKTNFHPRKIPVHIIDQIGKLIEENLESISKLPPSETRKAMDDFVYKLQPCNWKDFVTAFMKYLQDPQRKVELYSKVNSPPAPPMTKNEQILLYVLIKLKSVWPDIDIVHSILCQMEYVLFRINQTPEFDVIESMSHFYAAICRCFGLRIRLRSFMLDAMYCLQYKAIALVKQCIDVWMHVIPLAHMGIAKNPLVTCLVYLLHFYKCEDHFNRVQDIRNILHRKYFYQMSDWNEKRILEVVRNSIYEVIKMSEEKKILRRSILLLAKRQGPRWCQKNIIMNMLLPIIEDKNSPENVKLFCIWMLGPLIKPYPADMKVHCEIVMNSLLDIAKQKPSPATQEAVFSSLIFMSRHNHTRVTSALLAWHPKHEVSPECYAVLRDFVREKPAHVWRRVLSKPHLAGEVEMGRTEDNLDRD